jgi:hypothetical protein
MGKLSFVGVGTEGEVWSLPLFNKLVGRGEFVLRIVELQESLGELGKLQV